jgi:hypothetical protein
MNVSIAPRLTRAGEGLPRHRFTVAEVEAMVEAGIVDDDERVELIGGRLIDLGEGDGEDPSNPPEHGEVVYADASHALCRRWNWRQDPRSLLTPQARRAVLTVQSSGFGDVEAAARRIAEGIARECGGSCRIVVADRRRRSANSEPSEARGSGLKMAARGSR